MTIRSNTFQFSNILCSSRKYHRHNFFRILVLWNVNIGANLCYISKKNNFDFTFTFIAICTLRPNQLYVCMKNDCYTDVGMRFITSNN